MSDYTTSAYALVEELVCAVRNSGFSAEASQGAPAAEAKYLAGCVVARLRRRKPPYKNGTKVLVTKAATWRGNGRTYSIRRGEERRVVRVWYIPDTNSWFLQVDNMAKDYPPIYPASCFEQLHKTA